MFARYEGNCAIRLFSTENTKGRHDLGELCVHHPRPDRPIMGVEGSGLLEGLNELRCGELEPAICVRRLARRSGEGDYCDRSVPKYNT